VSEDPKQRNIGKIKWINEDEQYGAIAPLVEGEDVIFQFADVDEDFVLNEDDLVDFVEEQRDDGIFARAKNIRRFG
jgi:cold shock CspA family protein